jgi:hypothetical protein
MNTLHTKSAVAAMFPASPDNSFIEVFGQVLPRKATSSLLYGCMSLMKQESETDKLLKNFVLRTFHIKDVFAIFEIEKHTFQRGEPVFFPVSHNDEIHLVTICNMQDEKLETKEWSISVVTGTFLSHNKKIYYRTTTRTHTF